MNSETVDTNTLTQAMAPAARARFHRLIVVERAGSTNDLAFELTDQLAPGGAVVIATSQTGGRGRFGREWSSPAGNLYLSVSRRIVEPMEKAGIVSLLAGLALARAVEEQAGLKPDVKWPNDLQVKGKKLAGILVEARETLQVVGLGLNVNTTIEQLSPDVAGIATTLLAETGRTFVIERLAAAFLTEFASLEAKFEADPQLPVGEYLEYFPFVGAEVDIAFPNRSVTGKVKNVASDGALIIATARDPELRVSSGEVKNVRRTP